MRDTSHPSHPPLSPSLWRTCRVLANRVRLRILGELFDCPAQSVAAVAARVAIAPAVASQYLRDLNARGLLRASRMASSVLYTPEPDPSLSQARPLLQALRKVFRTEPDAEATIFRLVTAFTHPRRIALVAALHRQSCSASELIRKTGISQAALVRHLRKLRERGFLCDSRGQVSLAKPASPLARTLLELARASGR